MAGKIQVSVDGKDKPCCHGICDDETLCYCLPNPGKVCCDTGCEPFDTCSNLFCAPCVLCLGWLLTGGCNKCCCCCKGGRSVFG